MKRNKVIIFFVLTLVVLLGFYVAFAYMDKKDSNFPGHATTATSLIINELGYECSKPIEGTMVKTRGQFGNGYFDRFVPLNLEDVSKFCRPDGTVIEYRAVLDILQRDDVKEVIEKYHISDAWVKALSHKYIHDKEYLKRILPAYSNIKIDCIIVVHSPEGTRFFIENGEKHKSHDDHQYIEVDSDDFLLSLNKASDEDVSNFWLGLR